MSIYKNGLGDELINPFNYNSEILLYLEEEKKIIKRLCLQFEVIVECGCMNGRNFELISSFGRKYIGVDIIDRYIHEAQKKYQNSKKCLFICGDIINISHILHDRGIPVSDSMVLIFPFNSFGNVLDAQRTLKVLLKDGFNVAIFTYKIDEHTNSVRVDYYNKSGFNSLKKEMSSDVVRFYSSNGLNSKAYSKDWFSENAKGSKYHFNSVYFSNIGVLYKNF